MKKNNWTRDELIIAFNLYCKTPFSKIGLGNKNIQDVAKMLGRSVSAVALKLANFARLDPDIQSRGLSGMTNGSKAEISIWNEFNENWEELAFASESIWAKYMGVSIETEVEVGNLLQDRHGVERESLVKLRVNQNFFREMVLASYNNKCCITGVALPEILVASHIKPWSLDFENRMNPANALCLNSIHDKAFDKGLITITPEFKIKLSNRLKNSLVNTKADSFFFPFEGERIFLPQKFLPKREFLEYHGSTIFQMSD